MSSVGSSVIYLGLDVHKESVTIAVLPDGAAAPTRVERLPNDLAKLRRFCERLRTQGEGHEVRACYEASLEYKLSRRDELDRQIAALALTPAVADAVQRLQCFRGLQVHGAMVLATELVDWRRFENPRQLMAYLGLVPREHSSGDRERRGSLTKAGNSHCRHVLVQAAWAYRFQPKVGVALKARQRAQSPTVIAHAWKAQHRLHTLYQRLAFRTKPQIAVVAVARELVGFLWAVMQDAPAPVATAA
jgi:hypothetical protein